MNYKILWTKTAQKDLKNIKQNAVLYKKLITLAEVLSKNPFADYPAYEKLCGDLSGFYSRRINIKHRFVYKINIRAKAVQILSCRTHYE